MTQTFQRRLTCVFVLIFSIHILACRRPNQAHSPSINLSAGNVSFDTLSVLNRLSLSREDSLVLHFGKTDTLTQYRNINDTRRMLLSGDSLVYWIHTVTNEFLTDSDVSSFFSCVIRYTKQDPGSEVCTLRQDSIEVYLGSLSMYVPAVRFLDINYDGYQDVLLSFTSNTTGRVGANLFFVFDPKSLRFEVDTALYSTFHDLEIDIDTGLRLISEGGRVGVNGYGGSEYHWNGKIYELTAEISVADNDDGTATIDTRKELVNGKWVIVRSDTTWNK